MQHRSAGVEDMKVGAGVDQPAHVGGFHQLARRASAVSPRGSSANQSISGRLA